MSEREMREVLQAYAANQPVPGGLLPRIERAAEQRRRRRRWRRGGLAALVLAFAFLTFVPGGGTAVATVRQIQPTLFLRTNLAEAQKVARSPVVVPDAFPSYGGEMLPLGPDTPTLVGRWLSYETVAVTVSSESDGAGIMYFDLRRSTYLPEELATTEQAHPDMTTQPVKVGDYDGVAVLYEDEPVNLHWKTESHYYRLFVAGAESVDELVQIARQIR